jgi:hypothetical protein
MIMEVVLGGAAERFKTIFNRPISSTGRMLARSPTIGSSQAHHCS